MRFAPITDICDFQGGTQPPKSEWSDKPLDGYIRMLQIRDFTQSEKTSPEYVKKSKKLKTCESDDVLIGRYGASIGKILTGYSGAYNVAIVKTIPNEEVLNKKFLLCLLKSPSFQNFITTVGARAAQAGFNKSDLAQYIVPVLPLNDQIRIAHLLGKVEGLIAQRKQHLQQLDDLLKSVFLEMFGDPVRNEKEWDKPELKAFGKISTGNTPPRKDLSNYDGNFIEWIKTDNITGEAIFITPATEHLSKSGAQKARTLKKGALLVACIAGSVESIGRSALTDRTVSFNQQINAIQPGKDVNPLYLYGLFKLCRAYVQSRATKGMKKILTKGDFEKITMIKPPIELQNQFAVIIEKIERIKSQYKKSLIDLELLYGALSQQAFKGELNLSRVPLPTEDTKQDAEEVETSTSVKINIPLSDFFRIPQAANTAKVQTPEGRTTFLRIMLSAWQEQFSHKLFSLTDFMGNVQNKLWDLTDGELHLNTDDYDQIKNWLFDALKAEKLEQAYDDENNRVQLKPRSPKGKLA